MDDLIVFLLILVSGLVFSEFFKRLHLPFVVALIAAGIFFGPLGLNLIGFVPSMEFLGSLGAVFLMFMAGMEVNTDILGRMERKLIVLAVLNGGVPALTGFLITYFFGYQRITALIVGTIFYLFVHRRDNAILRGEGSNFQGDWYYNYRINNN